MITLSRRLTGVELSSTAATADAASAIDDVLDLAGGELREPPPRVALEAAIDAVRDAALHRYGPVGGLPALRSAVAERLSADGSRSIGADQVLITSGTKQALFHAMLSFVGAGEEVLVPAPYWPSHPAMIRLGGGVPVVVAAGSEHAFKVTPDLLDAAVGPRTRYLVFVNPANPSGAVYTPTEVEALGRWARRRGVVVISDEIYAGLAHASTEPTPIGRAVPALASSCLRVGGVSKTYAMTGWRIGWLAGPTRAIAAAATVQSHTASHPSNIAQAAALAVVKDGAAAWLADVRMRLTRRRQQMLAGLTTIPGLRLAGSSDVFYAFPSVEEHLGRTIGGRRIDSSAALADALRERAGIAVMPGEVFGAPGHLRLNYAAPGDELQRALARLRRFLA